MADEQLQDPPSLAKRFSPEELDAIERAAPRGKAGRSLRRLVDDVRRLHALRLQSAHDAVLTVASASSLERRRQITDLTRHWWEGQPLRRTRGESGHVCRICQRLLLPADSYYDGGNSRRAHVACVESLGRA